MQQPLASFPQARLIHFALAGGVATFAVLAFVLGPGMAERGGEDGAAHMALFSTPVIAALAAVSCAGGISLSRLLSSVPNKRIPAALEEIDSGKAPPEHLRGGIIGAAIAESGGLFACVATLLTGQTTNLAFAGLVVAVVLWLTPTPGRSRAMIE